MDDKLKLSKDEARSLWDEISANGLELETSERDFVECAYRIASDLDTPNIRHVLSGAVGVWTEAARPASCRLLASALARVHAGAARRG